VVRVTLDGRVEHCFERLNSHRKCEFLAFFPEEGVTLTELANAEVFSSNKSVVHYYLKSYRSFLDFQKKDNSCFKLMTLNEEGQELQRMARYLILMNNESNKSKRKKFDYLNIFLEKGNPGRMLQVISKVYFNGTRMLRDIIRFERDRDTRKLVMRLDDFGLVKTKIVQEKRKQTHIYKTELGQTYFYRFLFPVADYITKSCEPVNCELYRYVAKHWEAYVEKNGNGWNERAKIA